MRLFVGIELPDEVRSECARVQGLVKGQVPDQAFKWANPQLMHITLSFLGEVEESRVEELREVLHEAARAAHAGLLSLSHVGAFPAVKKPSVAFVGAKPSDELVSLQRLVSDAWESGAKPFKPHVTIARARDRAGARVQVPEVEVRPLGWKVAEFVLFQSVLRQNGPQYAVVERFEVR